MMLLNGARLVDLGYVMQTLLNIPKPYPGELLYSATARFALYYNLQKCKTVSQAILGQSTLVIPVLLPARLERLRGIAEGNWGMDLEDVALRHTVLPFYLLAIHGSPIRCDQIMSSVLSDAASQLHKTLGITTSQIVTPRTLRYCPQCVDKDREEYGETYWHSHHQLPGVFVCADHGIPLLRSQVPVQPTRRQAPVAAETVIDINNDAAEPVPPGDLSRVIQFSRCAQDTLDRGMHYDFGQELHNWREKLSACGFDGKRGGVKALHSQFIEYWGEELIQQVEPSWVPGRPLTWLNTIRHTPRKQLHPTRYLLLEHFLDSVKLSRAPSPFGDGPWACPNWLADHHNQKVVSQYEDIHDHHHPERTIRRFQCGCGFVFTRFAESIPGQKDYRVVDFGPLFPKCARELASDGLSTRAIATTLGVDWKTAFRFLEDLPPSDAPPHVGLGEDRTQWICLVDHFSGLGVKMLRTKNPALYARLYRNDREWLVSHSPKDGRKKQQKLKVDWDKRDCDLAQAINDRALWFLEHVPRKQITRTALTADLNCQAMVDRNLSKLPMTQQALATVCESREDFRIRRLKSAIELLPVHSPRWRIIKCAGLRPNLVSSDVLRAAGFLLEDAGCLDGDC